MTGKPTSEKDFEDAIVARISRGPIAQQQHAAVGIARPH